MMLNLVIYTWPYAVVFWGVMAWAFSPEFRIVSQPKEKSADAQHAHSKQVIIAGQGPAVIARFAIAAKVPSAALAHPLGCFRAGPSATIAASLLRRHCWRMLGASFTAAVAVRPEHSAFERGAYTYVRHPSYRAGIDMSLGVGLALRNWITLAVLAPLP